MKDVGCEDVVRVCLVTGFAVRVAEPCAYVTSSIERGCLRTGC
jgi:hypothetical protein